MKINYLKEAKNLQELKSLYYELCKKFHPDINGNSTLEAMQCINNEYDYLKTTLKNASDTKKASFENDYSMTSFKNIIDELLKYKNVKIDIVGSWLWVYGYGTFNIKQEILYDKYNFGYSKGNKKFYWYEGIEENEGKFKGGFLNKAIDKYGKTTIISNANNPLCLQ